MSVVWKIMRFLFKSERGVEDFFFDMYKSQQGRKKIKNYRALLKKNEGFRDKYLGKRCFIIGNGPSLKELDLSLLRDEYTFTVNQFPKNPQFNSIHTTFHIWSDNRFFNIDDNDQGDLELLETMRSVNTAGNKPYVFYEISAKKMIERFHLHEQLDIFYFSALQFTKKRYLKKGKIDLTKVICNWPTVVQIAIIMAIYMGFKEIYLLGVDCTGFINIAQAKMKDYSHGVQYAFEMSQAEKERMEKTNSVYSMAEELRNQALILDYYELLNSFTSKKDICLYNATPGGLLESIERVDYREVVGSNGDKRQS